MILYFRRIKNYIFPAKNTAWCWGCILILFCTITPDHAQTILSGTITDATTQEPIPFAAAAIVNHEIGSMTDTNGHFRISTSISKGLIRFSASGYETRVIAFDGDFTFSVALNPNKSVIGEVTVKAKNAPYKNKDNPAVALIRKVIDHKKDNQLSSYQHVQYDVYEKALLSLENPGTYLRKNFVPRKYRFVFDNLDSTTIDGTKLLPLYIEENIYHNYQQKNPFKEQSVIKANKKVMLNKKYVNNESLGKILQYIYQDIDLYDNNIFILTNNFLSPIAPLAPQFYRFYITDTLINEFGEKTVKLSFEPRNNHDQLFYGTLFIALNGHYSLTKADISLPKRANVNWVNSFRTTLQYARTDSGKYYLSKNKISIEFGLEQLNQGVYGERTKTISNFDPYSTIPDSVYKTQAAAATLPDSLERSDAYWLHHRPDSLTVPEQKVYDNMDSLNQMPSFNRLVSWVSFLTGGYKNIGPAEIGPWSTFYSYNPVEGLKLRLGGRTTSDFSERFYFAGNIGYGFKDKRFKYYASAAYAFNRENIFWGYPQHYFQVSSFSDSRIPGRSFSFNDENNIFLSLKRGENNRYLYNQVFRLDYVNELIPHLRFNLQYERWKQEAAGGLYFIADQTAGLSDTINSLTTSGFNLIIRWAPHEKFLEGREGRTSIPSKYPIIQGEINTAFKGLSGGNYDFQKYQLSIEKRFYLSRFGHADVQLRGGYLSGKVPYPLLFIPPANQSYNYQIYSFNLMNYMEFINDHYGSLIIDYHMKGLILNNIPGIQWLRLREVAGFKAIYGSLRPENMGELISLPKDEHGQQATFSFGDQPYMEFNIGIENILNIIRIDYVRRLNYLQHPGISANGFRISVNLAF